MRIGIIGTAGRNEDSPKMTDKLYFKMVRKAADLIKEYSDVTLVSGGAAWADHVAISLYLMGKIEALELHLPCRFNNTNKQFDVSNATGRTANYYHRLFSEQMGKNTLETIAFVIKEGATVFYYNGFHVRNIEVGKVDTLIAFTWGLGTEPKDGGTFHTWKNSRAPHKIHIPLNSL